MDILIFVIEPIALGALVYYIFFPEVIFVKAIDTITGLNRHIDFDISNKWIQIIRYYFFDMLWAFSLTSIAYFIINPERNRLVRFTVWIIIFEVFFEMIQLFDCIRGTFDILDIAAEIFINVLVIYLMIWRNIKSEKT